MADRPEAPDVPTIVTDKLLRDWSGAGDLIREVMQRTWREMEAKPTPERDAFGEITTKTKDLRPYNQAKERQLEMNRLLAFFKAMERCWPFCPVCGNHNIEWKWPCR